MTAKEKAIHRVLEKRMAVIEDHILTPKSNQTPLNRAYYQGKRDGYMQAMELLTDSLECISVEIV